MPAINVRSVDDAKAMLRDEKIKIANSWQVLVGSPVVVAVFAALAIAFGAHLIYAPDRLPSIGGFGVAAFGLPPLDFGIVSEGAQEAAAAAGRQGAAGEVQGFFAENPGAVPIVNGVAFGATFVLLIWALAIQTGIRKRKALAGV